MVDHSDESQSVSPDGKKKLHSSLHFIVKHWRVFLILTKLSSFFCSDIFGPAGGGRLTSKPWSLTFSCRSSDVFHCSTEIRVLWNVKCMCDFIQKRTKYSWKISGSDTRIVRTLVLFVRACPIGEAYNVGLHMYLCVAILQDDNSALFKLQKETRQKAVVLCQTPLCSPTEPNSPEINW